jgi:thiamine pyrophosphokinase
MNTPTHTATVALVVLGGDPVDAVQIGELPRNCTVIAADAGVENVRRLNLEPDVVVGDMDSIDDAEIARLEARGTLIDRHPTDKDLSDGELALRYAVAQGVHRVILVGGGGGRLDHQLATIATMFLDVLDDVSVEARLAGARVHAVRTNECIDVAASPGDIVGLVPFGGDAHGVSTEGLQWGLNNETLHVTASRGISNRALGRSFRVAVRDGRVVVIVERPPEGSTSTS